MSAPSNLDSLLARWEELQKQGLNASAAAHRLEGECPATMRKELAHAVRALQSIDSLLNAPDRCATEAKTPPEMAAEVVEPGIRVPGYEILGELGRGGMGIVYKARQLSLNRLVALKMLRAGGHLDPDRVARFRRETEVAARLQHPSIVQIFEVGESDGVAYFSMEFVDGGNLAQRLAGYPQPPIQAAPLVEVVARCVHAAHEKGIVHRDLKPANILLSTASGQGVEVIPFGHPKVSDFGLAKLLQIEGVSGLGGDYQTASGAVMGTPSYMAPEQAEGNLQEIGPATDIHALGAILYETLTGRPPFMGRTLVETLEQARTHEPVSPRRLISSIPRDLETICLKCLHKDPHKRYASARDLADDLQRFLNVEPITARLPGRIERIWRWCRRKPLAASLMAALALVVVVAFCTVSGFWLHAVEKRDEAQHERENAERSAAEAGSQRDVARREGKRADANAAAEKKQRERAENHLKQAKLTLDKLTDSLQRLRNFPEMDQVRRELLSTMKEFYEHFAQQEGDDPKLRAELGKAHGRLGFVLDEMGAPEESIASFKRMVDIFERLAVNHPEVSEYRSNLILGYNMLADRLTDNGKLGQAEETFRTGIAAGEKWVRVQNQLAEAQTRLAESYQGLGFLLLGRKDAVAGEAFLKALSICKKLAAKDGQSDRHALCLATVSRGLGEVYRSMGQLKKAEAAFEESIIASERLTRKSPDNPAFQADLAATYASWAGICSIGGNWTKAEDLLQKSGTVAEKIVRQYPRYSFIWFYNAARYATFSSNLILDKKTPQADQTRLAEKFAGQAVQLLKQAHKAGFFSNTRNVEKLTKGEAFQHLRTRPDFQELLRAVEETRKRAN